MIGIAQGLGIPAPMAAGAIISGALVGDKLSPLSDTTLLAAATSRVKLFDHILSLCYVTLPVSIISIIVYSILGFKYGHGEMNLASVQILSESLKSSCNIGVLMLVPLLFVLILSAMKKPTIPVFAGGLVIGCIWAVLFQNIPLTDVIGSAVGGFKSATGNADIDKLLSRGGALSMAETIFLCIGAGMFSGVFERTGVLSRLMDQLRKIVKSVGGLVFSVTLTGIALMFGGAGQSCTLSLPAIASGMHLRIWTSIQESSREVWSVPAPSSAPSCHGMPLPSYTADCSAYRWPNISPSTWWPYFLRLLQS